MAGVPTQIGASGDIRGEEREAPTVDSDQPAFSPTRVVDGGICSDLQHQAVQNTVDVTVITGFGAT